MTSRIETKVAGGVMTIRMNRPEKRNALNAAMYSAFANAIRDAEADSTVGAILILGVPGAFSAGNDIADFLEMASGGSGFSPVVDFLERLILAQKPLVAGVDGVAIGVGTTMLMHCDYVVASDRSLFRTPFVDLGVVPEAASSLVAPRMMGHHRAFAMLALGEPMETPQALLAGFVNRVVAPDQVEVAASAIATSLAAKPREALRISRELIRGDRSDIVDRMRKELAQFEERLKSSEARTAFAAFMNKSVKKS